MHTRAGNVEGKNETRYHCTARPFPVGTRGWHRLFYATPMSSWLVRNQHALEYYQSEINISNFPSTLITVAIVPIHVSYVSGRLIGVIILCCFRYTCFVLSYLVINPLYDENPCISLPLLMPCQRCSSWAAGSGDIAGPSLAPPRQGIKQVMRRCSRLGRG